MANGYDYEEKEKLKTQVDVTELLKEWYHDDFLYRTNGTMVSKELSKRSLVIYPKTQTSPSHGYIHHKPNGLMIGKITYLSLKNYLIAVLLKRATC